MLGTTIGTAGTLFGFCDHTTNRAPAQSAGTKGKGFVKTIVQLTPLAIGRQLPDHARGKI